MLLLLHWAVKSEVCWMSPDYLIAPYILRDIENYLTGLLDSRSASYIFETYARFLQVMGLNLMLTSDGFRVSLG